MFLSFLPGLFCILPRRAVTSQDWQSDVSPMNAIVKFDHQDEAKREAPAGPVGKESWTAFRKAILTANRRTRIELIRKSLPASAIGEASREFRCTHDDICAMAMISSASVRRLSAEAAMLSPSVTERLARLVRIDHLATQALGSSEAARAWLKVSQGWLGGHTPLSMLATEDGGALIEEALAALLYGDPV